MAECENSTIDLERMYQKLWEDELKLLEDERFKEVAKILIGKIHNSGLGFGGEIFEGYFVK